MPVPSDSAAEAARLAVLADSGVLGPATHPAFDRVAGLAARLFGVPTALVSFIGRDRQWIKGRVGTELVEIERALSFCAHTLAIRRPLVVPDLSHDGRFSEHPLVTAGPLLRFYAGAPLTTADGHDLGALCILDVQPRRYFGGAGEAILLDLAAVVVDEVELMRAARSPGQPSPGQPSPGRPGI